MGSLKGFLTGIDRWWYVALRRAVLRNDLEVRVFAVHPFQVLATYRELSRLTVLEYSSARFSVLLPYCRLMCSPELRHERW